MMTAVKSSKAVQLVVSVNLRTVVLADSHVCCIFVYVLCRVLFSKLALRYTL